MVLINSPFSHFVPTFFLLLDAADNPAALHDPLKTHFAAEFGEHRFEKYFNLMYTCYSLPNIIIPIFGGTLVDRVGYLTMNLVFCAFLILGQSLFAIGVTNRDMDLLLVGRTLYGIGGESILVGLSAMLLDWFGGSGEFAFVMGIKMSLGRMGSVFNNIGSRAFYHDEGISFAVWFSVILIVGAFVALLVLIVIDAWVKRRAAQNRVRNRLTREQDTEAGGASESDETLGDSFRGQLAGADGLPTPAPGSQLNLREIFNLRRIYWAVLLTCVLLYAAVLPFNNVSSALIIERSLCGGKCCPAEDPRCAAQSSAESKASFLMGIPFLFTCVFSPLVGFCVDRFGGNAILFFVSAVTLLVAHTIMSLTGSLTMLIIALVLLGLAYTIYASSVWPSVPATVLRSQVGLGLGLLTSAQNTGLAIFPMIVAEVRAESGSYSYVEVLFAILAGLGSLSAAYTLWYDFSTGGVLNMTAKERAAWQDQNEYQVLPHAEDSRQRVPTPSAADEDDDNVTRVEH
jgi:MFS family permease